MWARVKKATVAGPSSCWRFSSFPSRNTPLCVPIRSSDIFSLLYSAVAHCARVGHYGVNQYTPHTLAAARSGEVLVVPLDDWPCVVIRHWDSSVSSTNHLEEWSIPSALRVNLSAENLPVLQRGRHHGDAYVPCWPDALAVSPPIIRLRGHQCPLRRSAALKG